VSYPSTTKRIVLASEYQRKILEHLNSLVRFQTIDPKVMHRQHQRYLADQIECKNYLEASLLQLGIRTEIFTTPQSKNNKWIDFCATTGINPNATFYSLYGTTDPKREIKTRLIFTGHYDVVYADRNGWISNPFIATQEGNKIYGRGTSDMKGGIATLLTALEMYKKIIGDFPANIAIDIIIVSLEEIMGQFGAQEIADYLISSNKFPQDSQINLVELESTQSKIVNRRRMAGTYALKLPQLNLSDEFGITDIIHTFRSNGGHTGLFNINNGLQDHSLAYAVQQYFAFFSRSGYFPSCIEAGEEDGKGLIMCIENGIPKITKMGLTANKGKANLMLLAAMRFIYEITAETTWREPAESNIGTSVNPFFFKNGKSSKLEIIFRSFIEQEEVKRFLDEAVNRTNSYMKKFSGNWENIGYGELNLHFNRLAQDENSPLIKSATKVLQTDLNTTPEFFNAFGNSDLQTFYWSLKNAGYNVYAMGFGPEGYNEHAINEYVLFDSLERSTLFNFHLIKRLNFTKTWRG